MQKKPRMAGFGRLSTNLLISMVFLIIILLGTMLLLLPAASRNGTSCGWITALFTATSATCVTGLSLVDTYTQWSPFGQVVLACLIEIGGLGFMSIASILILLFRGQVGMKQQMLIAQSFGTSDMQDIVKMQKWMLKMCLVIQFAGMVLLTARFSFQYPFDMSIRLGLFHSISAFCNAGFDILGFRLPGSSVGTYATDPFVLLPLSALIVFGGLGYIVWEEAIRVRKWKKLSVYARLVLLTTLALLLSGTLLILICEYQNPKTLGSMTLPQKLLAAFFQSVTLRTAGFAGIPQESLTDAGKSVSMFLMLIGGSSGSTAGGLKTVTFVVVLLFLRSRMTGKPTVTVFHRTIPTSLVINALSIYGLMVFLSVFGATVLTMTSPLSLTEALYECVSAIATVGLSCNATSRLSLPGKLLICLYMYFGRVGILTIALGFLHPRTTEPKYRYADTSLLIG